MWEAVINGIDIISLKANNAQIAEENYYHVIYLYVDLCLYDITLSYHHQYATKITQLVTKRQLNYVILNKFIG